MSGRAEGTARRLRRAVLGEIGDSDDLARRGTGGWRAAVLFWPVDHRTRRRWSVRVGEVVAVLGGALLLVGSSVVVAAGDHVRMPEVRRSTR